MKKTFKFLTVFLLALLGASNLWATDYTVYFSPQLCGKSWSNPYVGCDPGWSGWHDIEMTSTGKTFHGFPVYSATIHTHDTEVNVNNVQFHEKDNFDDKIYGISSWGSPSSLAACNGKICTGKDTWVDYVADSEQTFYFCPKVAGKDWTTPYANCNLGYNHWSNVQMTEVSGKTFCGQKVYQATVTTCAFDKIEFHKSSSDYSGKIELTNPSGVNGKLYNGSEWKTFSYDTEYTFYFATDWNAVYVNCNLGYSIWKDLAMTNTGKTYNGKKIYSITVVAQGFNDIEFHKSQGGDWDSKVVGYSNSTTYKKDFTNALCTSANNWVAYNYDVTLTFDPQNGDASITKSVLKGGSITAPAAPEKTGYDFKGWKNGSTTVQAGETISNVQADATYEAQWEQQQIYYNYTFGRCNGQTDDMGTVASEPSAGSILAGTSITLTAAPKTGYEVEGWYSNADCTSAKLQAGNNTYTFNIGADISVYVKFKYINYTVSFNVNLPAGGSITTPATKPKTDVHYNVPFDIVAAENTGYHFTGWTSTSNISITDKDALSTQATLTDVANNKTITANFAANTYKVRFNANTGEGEMDDEDFTYNVSKALTANSFTKTGYDFKGWDTDPAGKTIVHTNGKTVSNLTAEDGATVQLYAVWAPHAYTISYKDQDDATYSGNNSGLLPTTHTYDTQTALVPGTKIGYEFQGWHKKSDCSDAAVTTIGAQEITDNITLYAKWQINTYNITYPVSPAHYTITENTTSGDYNTSASFKATPEDGYRLVVTATKAGGGDVSLNQNNYSYSFNIPADDVTISVTAYPYKIEVPQIGSESGQLADFVNGTYTVTLAKTSWYTFRLYNEGYTNKNSHYMGSENSWNVEENLVDGKVTMNDNAAAFWLCTGVAGTYTFTIKNSDDNKPVLSITYPNVSTLTIDHQSKADDVLQFTQVGSSNIWRSEVVALEQNKTYNTEFYWEGSFRGNKGTMTYDNHTGWHMQHFNSLDPKEFKNMKLQTRDESHNAGNYYFEFNTENHYLTAVYPSYFRSNGDGIGWDNSHPLTFDENGIAVFEFEATRAYKGDGILQVKVVDEGQYYTLDKMVTTSASNEQFIADPDENKAAFKVQIVEEMLGKYTFTYNKKNHQMSVGYPDTEQFEITYTDAEGTKTIKAGPNGGRGISAANKPGYRFTGWVISPDNTYLTVADNDLSRQTTTVYGKKDGGSLTATYSNDEFIYFKNIPGWSNVNVYFYSEDYFDSKNGSGCLADKDEKKRKAYGWAMTHIPNTDIWYLDYKGMDRKPSANIVAFSDHLQNDNQWFYECQVAYRKDFSTCTPMYMPVNWIHERLCGGKTAYYEQGCWMKFDSQESGYEVKLYDRITDGGAEMAHVDLNADGAGGYVFTGTININFEKSEGYNYGFKIKNKCNETYFGNNGTMTSTNCTNWEFNSASDMQNCGLTTTTKGNYIFTISFDGGIMHVSVEYPVSNGDYRVVYKEGSNAPLWNGFYYKKSATDRKDMASFFITNGVDATVELQRGTNVSADPAEWEKVMDINTSSLATGVYNFEISQTNAGANATLTQKGLYTGNYYIRTDGVDGGWKAYATNSDNKMTGYGSLLDAGATYENFQYDYFKTKWIDNGKNVKFCIANDYSKNISSEFTTDATLGGSAQTLPQNTNVRFMWNSTNNQLSRAYISGSSKISDRFLVLEGDAKMFDKDGKALTTDGGGKISGLDDYELNFDDKNNWVYQADIKAQPGCAVKLTAAYNGTVQYFIGSETDSRTIITSSQTDTKQYTMRAVYDFKTNRLVAGWVPDGTQIDDELKLGGDMLLVREHQGKASQITFGDNGSISDIHHVYGVLTLTKTEMTNAATMSTDPTTGKYYENNMYWISFPFSVKISEIFGVAGYGTNWVIQRYDGVERAQKGWTKETPTFWKYMGTNEVMNAYEGYVLCLDPDAFNPVDADVWKNSATEANFYFPSENGEIGIVHAANLTQSVSDESHECKIDRNFKPEGMNIEMNHKVTDSHWNVIGIPAFQDGIGTVNTKPGSDPEFKSFYEWDPKTNGYNVKAIADETDGKYNFKTMHAYMVQFYGTINWENVSVVKPKSAPYQFADNKNYMIELFFNGNGAEDHTYVKLADGAHTDFELNEDMMKIDNAGQPNIYSFAGAYDVAYNETTMDNQSVMLGVSAPKDGSYTFAMPKDFSGKAVLVDLESGEATDLNLSNYTVELNKGTYNNRFQLLLEVEAKAPTNMNPTKGEWSEDGKTKKLFINDNIYLINAGRIYNASGTQVK